MGFNSTPHLFYLTCGSLGLALVCFPTDSLHVFLIVGHESSVSHMLNEHLSPFPRQYLHVLVEVTWTFSAGLASCIRIVFYSSSNSAQTILFFLLLPFMQLLVPQHADAWVEGPHHLRVAFSFIDVPIYTFDIQHEAFDVVCCGHILFDFQEMIAVFAG